MEWATNKNRIIIGSLCPHCGARIGPDIPMGRVMLITFVGAVAVLAGVDFLNGSQAAEMVLVPGWMVCVWIWYARRPLIVLPEDYNPYNL